MKKIQSILWSIGFAMMTTCFVAPANAQTTLPEGTSPMIVVPHTQTISFRERTLCYDVTANVAFEVTASQDWAQIRKGENGDVYVHISRNVEFESRTVNITFSNADNGISETLVLTQGAYDPATEAPAETPDNVKAIFADDICSALNPGVTQEQVNQITNMFYRDLANKMLAGEYETEYRVASYPCLLSYVTLSNLWNAPGKYYDQIQGVTGINFSANSKQAVLVSGIPEGVDVQLKVVAWYVGKDGDSFDGGNPNTTTYTLKNGMNIIDYTYDYDGLAYVCYYVNDDPSKYDDVKVHFVNGEINGYLSPEKTNESMHALCANAKNVCMDVVGQRVHSIWTSEGLKNYCRASDGYSLGYRQYMNLLDSLIVWEHRLLGFEKYDKIPTNKTMAYTNYTYYMFQGSFGVSFHHNQESRVLNCKQLMYNDDDAIWGLSHEWGHQHQMHPYFCWAGMSEVTNNMNSYYNIMQMGYTHSDKIQSWPIAREHFITKDNVAFTPTNGTAEKDGGPYYERRYAYEYRDHYAYSQDMFDLCASMEDYQNIPTAAEDPTRAMGITEVSVGEILCPFIMLYNYATETKGLKDFGPDLYESLRQTDDENGSQIEKQGEVDKYELIASAQNNNKNNKLDVLDEKFPGSCWSTLSGNNYILKNYNSINNYNGMFENSVPYIFNFIRKTSRLLGYNLFPYYEKWGFLRQIALRVGDYGNKFIVLTKKMYDEFKTDMDALVESGELKAMPDGMIEEISNTKDLFEIWGHAAGSATTPPAIPN